MKIPLRWLTIFAALLVILVSAKESRANFTLSSHDTEKIELAPFLQILEDPTRSLTLEQVRNSNQFQSNGNNEPVPGYTTSAWWVRFELTNPSSEAYERYIEFADSGEGIPHIDFFLPNQHGETDVIHSGGAVPQTEKMWNHRFNIIPFSIPPQTTSTFYIRAEGDSVKIPIHLYTQNSFLKSMSQDNLWLGANYGFLVVLLASNLFVFFATGERSYLYYVAFLLGIVFSLGGFDGFVGQYFFPNHRYFHTRVVNIAATCAVGALHLFTSEFLQLRKHKPNLHKLALFCACVAFCVAIMNAIYKHNQITNLTVTVDALVCIAIGIASVFQRIPLAWIYTTAFPIFTIGVLITALKQASILPINFFTEEALRIATLSNALFLALALVYRFRYLQKEQERNELRILELDHHLEQNKSATLNKLAIAVIDISDKLNSPLLVIVHVVDRIRERFQHINPDTLVYTQQATDQHLTEFVGTWTKQIPEIENALDDLKSLSKELAEHREQNTKFFLE